MKFGNRRKKIINNPLNLVRSINENAVRHFNLVVELCVTMEKARREGIGNFSYHLHSTQEDARERTHGLLL